MKWVLRALGAVLLLGLLSLGLLAMIPTGRIAALATAEFQRLTGRALVLEGDVSPRFWPVLGVTTGPVEIANAAWSKLDAPMLRADSLQIEINASALLGGDIRILGIRAVNPTIVLERAADGRENWVFGGGGQAGEVSAATPGIGRAYSLEEGRIEGGTLRWVDHSRGQDLVLDNLDATLRIPDFTGPATLSATAVTKGQAVVAEAEAGSFSALTEGRLVPLTVKASVGGASVRFGGSGGWQPMVAKGRIEADLSDTAALAALTGAAPPELPAGLGAKTLTASGDLTLDGSGTAFLRGAKIQADGNAISGDLDLSQGKQRPRLRGQLHAATLDLRGLSGGQGDGAGGGMAAGGWPKDRMDVSNLGALDADLALVVGAVDLGVATLGETRLFLTIDRSRAVFDIRQMAAYGGSVTGEFVVNGRGGLSIGGDLSLAGLQMQPLLTDLSGWDRLIAQGTLTLKFLGVGNTVDAIMQGLKGEGRLSLGKGELRGLDIAGMLRTLDAGYVGEGQKTIFDGVAASFTIADGVLSNSDLKLAAPYLTAGGAGRIGLGARDLDYRLRPTALAGADGTGGIMVPLLITGPWAKPRFKLDLESIAREKMEAEAKATEERLKAEAKAAEAKTKADLEARLKQELGVEVQSGESLEDALARRAQEELGKDAGKLLKGLLKGK